VTYYVIRRIFNTKISVCFAAAMLHTDSHQSAVVALAPIMASASRYFTLYRATKCLAEEFSTGFWALVKNISVCLVLSL